MINDNDVLLAEVKEATDNIREAQSAISTLAAVRADKVAALVGKGLPLRTIANHAGVSVQALHVAQQARAKKQAPA